MPWEPNGVRLENFHIDTPLEQPPGLYERTIRLGLVDTDHVLRIFSESKSRAQKHYRAFMEDEQVMKKSEVYATIDQRLQGDEEFVDRVLQKYDGEVKREQRKKEYTLPQIAKAVEQRYDITLQDLRPH